METLKILSRIAAIQSQLLVLNTELTNLASALQIQQQHEQPQTPSKKAPPISPVAPRKLAQPSKSKEDLESLQDVTQVASKAIEAAGTSATIHSPVKKKLLKRDKKELEKVRTEMEQEAEALVADTKKN